MEKEKKDKWVKVRIDETEREYWHEKAKASGRTLSDLIREALERVRRWSPVDKESEKARLRALARIGSNLNQIAKWANTYKSAAEATEIISHLITIERLANAERGTDSFPTAPLPAAIRLQDHKEKS